jgi:hypothetical protein
MKTILIACVALIVVSIGAYYGLGAMGFDSASQVSSGAVRLD